MPPVLSAIAVQRVNNAQIQRFLVHHRRRDSPCPTKEPVAADDMRMELRSDYRPPRDAMMGRLTIPRCAVPLRPVGVVCDLLAANRAQPVLMLLRAASYALFPSAKFGFKRALRGVRILPTNSYAQKAQSPIRRGLESYAEMRAKGPFRGCRPRPPSGRRSH